MKIKIGKLQELIDIHFDGNQKKCARCFNISREYLNKVLKNEGNSAISPKICIALITYCEKNNLNYREYIFLN